MSVTAIIVTRGDVELDHIIGQEWPDSVHEIVVWNNADEETDLGVYGRYAAIKRANFDLIYVQDDDVVLPRESLQQIISSAEWIAEERSGHEWNTITANMPANFRHDFYQDHALVGFGACFHRDAPRRAFERMPWPEGFLRTCDIVFTGLTPRVLVDVPYEDLPWASAENRMWKQPTHREERQRMLDFVREVLSA